MKHLILLILMCGYGWAQTQEAQVNGPEEKTASSEMKDEVDEVKEDVKNSSLLRQTRHHTLMGGLEAISSWLPFKLAGSYTYNFNKQWTLEAEFARGHFGTGLIGIDLASVNEYRYSLLARRYAGNSFHTIFGLYKDDFRARVGNTLLMDDSAVNDLKVHVLGVALGMGNRWQWQSGLTLGVDWIRMNFPLIDRYIDDDVLKNVDEDDREDIEDGIDKVASVPTFVLFGIYLGYSF